ncbi:choline ABC transporter ATP-binding protein [Gynuella sunshinyii]|uniref:ABC-type proline/glycine betaine transport system, ATPase component n=1 Tax=Gynuella sunshinyii YC6258 TaxID=1445510 RepID=A0A0C5V2L7_9GAMM|nr:choline ABC transporter ATP-binding protein [Gynuella sunshinyii]AJQ93725.1 ABC-type proline/glycine betaine transport system, ATPase component [Gynuella sunshinyii YC6258]
MPAISIRNLDVIFGQQITDSLKLLDQGKSRQEIIDATGDVVGVQNASLDIEEGEICVLMGLSGSGKSSLLRAVNGLNAISRGELLVQDGERMIDLANCDEKTLRHLRAKRISMVFQKFALMPWLKVIDNVAYGLEVMGMNKNDRHKKAMEQLDMVGLADWKDKYPHELSGGMQQRVGLARAFAMDSDILLMDEPFSALDPLIRHQLQEELITLQKSLNKTILFVSHDLDEALKIGSRIAIMESARIIQCGAPADIVLNPATPYVENFVAHTNPLNVLEGHTLMTEVEALEQQDGRLLADPHHQVWLTVEEGKVAAAEMNGSGPLKLQYCEADQDNQIPACGTLAMTSPKVSMRRAIELCYSTELPVILVENGKLEGVLCDQNFYHALLGKHFTTGDSAKT